VITLGVICFVIGLFVFAAPWLWILGVVLIVLGITHEVAPGNRQHWW
jgi:membrane-bound ClpP family serine protease